MRLAMTLALLAASAGCLAADDGRGPTPAPSPAQDARGFAPCAEGDRPFFAVARERGFGRERVVLVTRQADLVLLYRNDPSQGSPGLRVRDTHNVTAAEVRALLEGLDGFSEAESWNVTVASRIHVPDAQAADLCRVALDDFPGFAAAYPGDGCEDAPVLRVAVSTREGAHATEASCDAGPPSLDRFGRAVMDLGAEAFALGYAGG